MQSSPRISNLIIRASAGTGKTFQLSNRCLGLLSADVAADHLLATTFTRKAAGEILDRVLRRLATAATSDGESGELSRFIDDPSLDRQKCEKLLEALVKELHRLRVGTLDSFFAHVARSFSLELGLPPAWQIADELDDAALKSEAIDSVLQDENVQDLRTLLNLLAKGEATRGVSELVRATADDLYDLFKETERAAWENLPRYKPLNDADLADTVEQLRVCPVADKRMSGARDKDYLQALTGNWPNFIARGLAAKVLDGSLQYYRKPIPDELAACYDRLIDHAKAELIGRVAMQTKATYDLLERFHAAYQRLKQDRRAMRFEDITERVAAVSLRDGFSYRLDGHIDHLLLDEFQDTSPPQWRAVQPIARHVSESLPQRSFFCVGDMKQAIYGWRGGVAEIFDAVAEELPSLTAQSLNKSYRSSQIVIDTVNKVFEGAARHPNLDRAEPAVRQWCARFEHHEAAKTDLPGYACLVAAPEPREDQHRHDAVLEFTADRVKQIVSSAPGCSVGVLVRKNATVARLIYLLRQREIPASEEGGNPLLDSAAVNVVLSLLRIADHPGDKVARFHVANSPLAKTMQLDDFEDRPAACRLSQQLRASLLHDGFGPTVYAWARELAAHCNRRELNRLEQLVELAYGYPAERSLRVDDFVQFVEIKRVADPSAANVRVMTVHQAKGLEFDVVVLPELDVDLIGQSDSFVVERDSPTAPAKRVCRYAGKEIRQLMPADLQKLFDDAVVRDVNESLCVLYVSLTRAIHALHMIIPPSVKGEKAFPRKFSGLLRVALRDTDRVEPNQTVYEAGDPQWYRQVERMAEGVTDPAAPAELKPLKIQLAPMSTRRDRGLDRTSPSMLEGGSHVRAADLFDSSGTFARQRGTLIHAFFEQIQWLDNGIPEPAELEQVAAQTPEINIPIDQIRVLVAEFQAMLANPQVARSLSRTNYQPNADLTVENERRIAYREGDHLITGSIDRLVIQLQNGRPLAAEIIDFKTDVLPPGGASALNSKIDYYRPQIAAYRQAVAKMYALHEKSITAKLLFVSGGKSQTV